MDYALNAAKGQANYAAQTNYNTASVGAVMSPQPTVASALGHIESLNGRLDQITKQLAGISDAVGGPRPTSGELAGGNPAPSGIVYRLNDGANAAHRQLNDIEELIATIARALG